MEHESVEHVAVTRPGEMQLSGCPKSVCSPSQSMVYQCSCAGRACSQSSINQPFDIQGNLSCEGLVCWEHSKLKPRKVFPKVRQDDLKFVSACILSMAVESLLIRKQAHDGLAAIVIERPIRSIVLEQHPAVAFRGKLSSAISPKQTSISQNKKHPPAGKNLCSLIWLLVTSRKLSWCSIICFPLGLALPGAGYRLNSST